VMFFSRGWLHGLGLVWAPLSLQSAGIAHDASNLGEAFFQILSPHIAGADQICHIPQILCVAAFQLRQGLQREVVVKELETAP
jgi:hypothetical protein